MSKVLLENVGKTFDGKKMVLNDFSLQIDDGDFVVLIGPSGCGKTTILNIIAGLECPTTGNVYIDDALSNSVEPKDRDVAMVFQNHALYPHLSVYKNLAFPLKLRKYSKKDIEKEVFFIPKQLLQTARLDGLSEPKIFLKVYFPNMIPTFVTSGVLVFFEVWNGLLFPLIILQSQKNIMLPIFINSYGTSYTTNYGSFMLLLLITMLPTILLCFE